MPIYEQGRGGVESASLAVLKRAGPALASSPASSLRNGEKISVCCLSARPWPFVGCPKGTEVGPTH